MTGRPNWVQVLSFHFESALPETAQCGPISPRDHEVIETATNKVEAVFTLKIVRHSPMWIVRKPTIDAVPPPAGRRCQPWSRRHAAPIMDEIVSREGWRGQSVTSSKGCLQQQQGIAGPRVLAPALPTVYFASRRPMADLNKE